jgi:hypothetical protein
MHIRMQKMVSPLYVLFSKFCPYELTNNSQEKKTHQCTKLCIIICINNNLRSSEKNARIQRYLRFLNPHQRQ